jgi:hypothetical protein
MNYVAPDLLKTVKPAKDPQQAGPRNQREGRPCLSRPSVAWRKSDLFFSFREFDAMFFKIRKLGLVYFGQRGRDDAFLLYPALED